ncbi:unnamed protein product, partial [Meganyctiphanes norvegica]
PNVYTYIGPMALTRTAKQFCGENYSQPLEDGSYKPCNGLKILNNKRFYPFLPCKIYKEAEKGLDIDTRLATSYGMHVCNKYTRNYVVGQNSYYDVATRRYCPLVHSAATHRSDFW